MEPTIRTLYVPWPSVEVRLAQIEAQILRPSWVFTQSKRDQYGISDELADWLTTIPPIAEWEGE